MDAAALLRKHYAANPDAGEIVLQHSRLVAAKALDVAASLSAVVDLIFIEQAALLHDIGVCLTNASFIGCSGTLPYLCHGIAGRQILEEEGLPRHAMVCERHIGVGLTKADIERQNLPLPLRDMVPVTLEERIVAFADLFYSKHPGKVSIEKSAEEIRAALAPFGTEKVSAFNRMYLEFCSR